MLEAEELNLFVDLFKLLRKEYVVDGITVYDGSLRLADLAEGSNYTILKPDSVEGEPVSFAIDDLNMINCHISYYHAGSAFMASGLAPSLDAQLKASSENLTISITSLLEVDSIKQSGDFYLKGQELLLNTKLTLEDDYQKVIISPSDLKIEDVDLKTKGLVLLDDESFIDIDFENLEAPVKNVISITPTYVQQLFDHLELEGKAEIQGAFKGRIGETTYPSFELSYKLKEAGVKVIDQKISVTNISASGKIDMPDLGDLSSSTITAQIGRANSGSDYVKGAFLMENFNRPLLKWDGEAFFNASTLSALDGHGELKLKRRRSQSRREMPNGL